MDTIEPLKKEILSYASTWMNLKNIMLSQKNQVNMINILYDFLYDILGKAELPYQKVEY